MVRSLHCNFGFTIVSLFFVLFQAEIDDFINEEALDDLMLAENGVPVDATGFLDANGNKGISF